MIVIGGHRDGRIQRTPVLHAVNRDFRLPAENRHDLLALPRKEPAMHRRQERGFTLVELLIVMTIIGLVSILVIPAVFTGLSDQRMVGSVQVFHGALVEAVGFAASSHSPCGVRLMPSPVNPDSLSQIVPLVTPPRYTDGLVSTFPGTDYSALTPLPCLVIEQSPGYWVQSGPTWTFQPNSPTSWCYNVRLGDRILWAGKPYTACGPMGQTNADLFVNPPGSYVNGVWTPVVYTRTYTAPDGVTTATAQPDYLFLVNGVEDRKSG